MALNLGIAASSLENTEGIRMTQPSVTSDKRFTLTPRQLSTEGRA